MGGREGRPGACLRRPVAVLPTRDGGTIDQIGQVIAAIRRNPSSRRLIVTAWNRRTSNGWRCRPCHCLFQFLRRRRKAILPALPTLGRHFHRRSFQHRFLRAIDPCGRASDRAQDGEFIHTLGDAHLYLNHLQQADEQLQRQPLPLARLLIKRDVREIDDFRYEDFEIAGYEAHPHIAAPVAV